MKNKKFKKGDKVTVIPHNHNDILSERYIGIDGSVVRCLEEDLVVVKFGVRCVVLTQSETRKVTWYYIISEKVKSLLKRIKMAYNGKI